MLYEIIVIPVGLGIVFFWFFFWVFVFFGIITLCPMGFGGGRYLIFVGEGVFRNGLDACPVFG